ncbi:MAG: hypothetical protein LUJ09_09100 [Firmicutes bacterium]|nr:hypothetical protein [Bacillota bacterium]
MKGEESLTEDQVKARRSAEREKRMAPLRSRVAALESESETAIAEVVALYSTIMEDVHTTHMICNRLYDHVNGRLDVYWNAALRKHSNFDKMPMFPVVDLTSTAEEAYTNVHHEIMTKAQALIQAWAADAKEVA